MIKQRHQDLILPDIILVKFDETDNWREDIQEKAGKIFCRCLCLHKRQSFVKTQTTAVDLLL